MSVRPEILFHEEQRFSRPLALLLLPVLLLPFGVVAWGAWRQLVKGLPFGNNPAPDGVLLAVLMVHLLITVGLIWLFLTVRLTTEVRQDGLHIRFRPFHGRERRIDGIRSWKARDYQPIGEFGGWGIRRNGRGDGAYNVRGSRGVDLELEGGKRLLIGSQEADRLAEALDRALRRRP